MRSQINWPSGIGSLGGDRVRRGSVSSNALFLSENTRGCGQDAFYFILFYFSQLSFSAEKSWHKGDWMPVIPCISCPKKRGLRNLIPEPQRICIQEVSRKQCSREIIMEALGGTNSRDKEQHRRYLAAILILVQNRPLYLEGKTP